MGGGYYDRDVAEQARSSSSGSFNYSGYVAPNAPAAPSVDPTLDPKDHIRECMNDNAVVVALDVTRSRGDDTKEIYDKLPMFMGQLELKGYIEGAAISFVGIGDADADVAPLQVGQFEADNRLDAVLSALWLEEGGGGTGQESYELAAYYYAHRTHLKCADEGRKGYFFFIGDEGFYPTIKREHLKNVLGVEVAEDVPAADAFAALQEKFHVFFIYPSTSWQDRKGDIDAEIKARVQAAGGQYEGVDVRASLIWNNRNDLDLHMMTPAGEHIYYGAKQDTTGGWLDVDQNVRGETTKPVENIRWRRGEAPAGTYRVYVQNYRFHEPNALPTPYKVEIEVNGEVKHFENTISPHGETRDASNQDVHTFTYDPNRRPKPTTEEEDARYGNYKDDVILAQWRSVIPPEHILRIEDPKAIIDVLLGALALASNATDLDGYIDDMRGRHQSDARLDETRRALAPLSHSSTLTTTSGAPTAARPSTSSSRRL